MRISVIGGSNVVEGDESYEVARELGRLLAESDHEVVCGGLGGVMEAVCRGAKEEGGTTVGLLPTSRTEDANRYVDVPVATGLGNARNPLVAMNGDGVVAVDGSYGTLSEIAHALDLGKRVVGIGSHEIEGVLTAETAEEAVEKVEGGSDERE